MESTNPFKIAQKQLDECAEITGLENETRTFLRNTICELRV